MIFHVLDVKVKLSLTPSMEYPRPCKSGTLFPRSSSSSTPQKFSACTLLPSAQSLCPAHALFVRVRFHTGDNPASHVNLLLSAPLQTQPSWRHAQPSAAVKGRDAQHIRGLLAVIGISGVPVAQVRAPPEMDSSECVRLRTRLAPNASSAERVNERWRIQA